MNRLNAIANRFGFFRNTPYNMTPLYPILGLLLISSYAYWCGKQKAVSVAKTNGRPDFRVLHSRPSYYGLLTAMWCGMPALVIFLVWLFFQDRIIIGMVVADLPAGVRDLPSEKLDFVISDLQNLIHYNFTIGKQDTFLIEAADSYKRIRSIGLAALLVVVLTFGIGFMVWIRSRIQPALRARNQVEGVVKLLLMSCSVIAILTTIGIILSVLYESIRFFEMVSFTDFLFGTKWSPQMAIREDQVGSSGAFGVIPVMWGTILISTIAMSVAIPVGLMAAIYLSEYANRKIRSIVKPLMEILAGIPTVVYGFFAALMVAPFIREHGTNLGFNISSESALAAGLVMGIMIIPFVSSLSDDVINAVPQTLRDGAYALGATKSETIKQVIIPAALPGIVGSALLAVSRAIGETMIVVMAAGLSANLTLNPLKTVTTVTVQIVTLLVGDQEFDSPKTLAAFALGLMLFLVTLALNIIALRVVRKYREQYE